MLSKGSCMSLFFEDEDSIDLEGRFVFVPLEIRNRGSRGIGRIDPAVEVGSGGCVVIQAGETGDFLPSGRLLWKARLKRAVDFVSSDNYFGPVLGRFAE